MDNENKNLQGSVDETELQDKVRQDVSKKIAEAAAEVQDEIESAAEVAVEEEAEVEEMADDVVAEEEAPAKEPKVVSLKLSSLILSLVGTAIIGALILLLGMQIPKWAEAIPEGSTFATVDGTKITDVDMEYYLYVSAMQYYQNHAEDISVSPADYDWAQVVEEGKTAEDIVKENALDMALTEVLILNEGDKKGVEFDPEEARSNAKMQTDQLINTYGKELVTLNAKRQALSSIKQYNRKIEQSMHMQAVQSDMQADPAKYYPEDASILEAYIGDEGATYKHIMIFKDDQEGADNEAKRAKAEEIYNRIQNGESFEALLEESEDTDQDDAGYSVDASDGDLDALESAVLALGVNEISQVVESDQGYHIIKRVVGSVELEKYIREQADIKVKERKLKKMSVKKLLKDIDTATEEFEALYDELEAKKTGK